MNVPFLIIALVCVGIAIFAFTQAGKKRSSAQQPPRRRDPFADSASADAKFSPRSLGPGAILSWGATDYVIRGTLTVRQGPYIWWEHMLDGGNGTEWLSVEVDEGQLELIMWKTQKGQVPRPLGVITVGEETFQEVERGRGEYTSEGNTGLPPQGELHYIDYEGDANQSTNADRRLGMENFDASGWEYSTGRVVLPGEFIVYPAPEA